MFESLSLQCIVTHHCTQSILSLHHTRFVIVVVLYSNFVSGFSNIEIIVVWSYLLDDQSYGVCATVAETLKSTVYLPSCRACYSFG